MWQFSYRDEEFLDKTLPVDYEERGQKSRGQQPWLVHSLSVNALNFCAFSMVFLGDGDDNSRTDVSEPEEKQSEQKQYQQQQQQQQQNQNPIPVLIAVPNALNSGAIDIFHLPLEKRISTVPAPVDNQTGMVMAVNIFFNTHSKRGVLYVCSAYEDGHVMVFACQNPGLDDQELENTTIRGNNPWKWKMLYASRPHTQPVLGIDISPSMDRFFSSSADAVLAVHPIPSSSSSSSSSLSIIDGIVHTPTKITNTKHAGQQGLRVRSDGKIFATAGWDSRMRVYSCKSLNELAVLKWHKEGCFAVCFADVRVDVEGDIAEHSGYEKLDGHDTQGAVASQHGLSLATIQRQRYQKVQNVHWLVAGSKDGKISLWDIY